MNDIQNKIPVLSKSATQSYKLLIIGFIIFILMIPVIWISTLINERNNRKQSVIDEISNKWGSDQIITGPFISVPYHRVITSKDTSGNEQKVMQKEFLQISPETLDITGNIQTELRHRGIFKVIGYSTVLDIVAVVPTSFQSGSIPSHINLEWDEAEVTFDISDQHALKDLQGTFNGQSLAFQNKDGAIQFITEDQSVTPKTKRYSGNTPESTITTKLRLVAKSTKSGLDKDTIKLHVVMTGTEKIRFITSALKESIHLTGDWQSPSFIGNILPETKTIDKKGFDAVWHTNYLASGNKNFWTTENTNQNLSNLGISFIIPVDSYQQTTRTLKYSILFLLLTFMMFFFAETITKQRIHPIQYLMVGCSLVVFYLLLLSISEHLVFGWSYLIAASSIVIQISLYCYSILKTRKFAIQIGSLLTGLYVFLYILLRLEDNALLIGSISLFVLLGIAMYAIRNVNWYNQE